MSLQTVSCTDMRVVYVYVVISNVQPYSNGDSPFVVVIANTNVGSGNTKLQILLLNSKRCLLCRQLLYMLT